MNATTTGSLLETLNQYLEVCKPRVVLLMLVTSVVGMILATYPFPPFEVFFWGNLGIGLCASAGAAVNQVIDQNIDSLMGRTKIRPIPQGKLKTSQVLVFASVLMIAGSAILLKFTNILCTILTIASFVGYAIIYTAFLKRTTVQNIVIGGLAGATPPLLGWVAVTGEIHPLGALLVLIIFLWTPPHFWALAIHRHEDYLKIDLPMMNVIYGEEVTRLQILLYTILMIMAVILPYVTGLTGSLYIFGSSLLNIWIMYWTIKLYRTGKRQDAYKLFWVSIYYLFGLFAVFLLDHYVRF